MADAQSPERPRYGCAVVASIAAAVALLVGVMIVRGCTQSASSPPLPVLPPSPAPRQQP